MDLPPEAIKEFKEIYKQEFGEELSDEAAYDKAMRVLQFFSILYWKEDGGFDIEQNSSFDNSSMNAKIEAK